MRTRKPWSAEEAGAEAAERAGVRPPPRRRSAPTRTDSKPPQDSQASRRRRMNWPLATAGPAPSAAACQSPRSRVEQGEDRRDQEILAQAAHLLEAGQGDRVQPPPGRRGVRPRQQVRGVARVGVGRQEPGGRGVPRAHPERVDLPRPALRQRAGGEERQAGLRRGPPRDQAGGAVRRAVVDHPHRGGGGLREQRRHAVLHVEALVADRQEDGGRRERERRGGGSGGARRRRSSVLSASPRRPAPRSRERERARLNALKVRRRAASRARSRPLRVSGSAPASSWRRPGRWR